MGNSYDQQDNFSGNAEHLNILLSALEDENVRNWNKWRLENPSIKPDLKGINLVGADLIGIDLISADLSYSDLSKANLSTAEMSGVILVGAKLIGTKFIHASIYGGGLGRADLTNANLDGAILNSATLSNAVITGAIIKGISTESWNIKNIICDYIYLDRDYTNREPANEDYEPGEFEKLYQYKPRIKQVFIDYTFVDLIIVEKVVHEINDQNPEYELRLDCLHARGKPRAEFIIKNKKDSKKILAEIEAKHAAIKNELIFRLSEANTKADAFKEILMWTIKEPRVLIENVEINNHKEIWNNFNDDLNGNMDQLVNELSNLRAVLKEKALSIEQDKTIGELADAEQAIREGDGKSVIKHLKNAGKWALDVSTQIGTDIATELLKKSLGL